MSDSDDVGPARPPALYDEGDDDVGPAAPPPPPPDESDDDVGPAAPSRPPADERDEDVGPTPPPSKKRRADPHATNYLSRLPSSIMYEQSYMHRDTVTTLAVSTSREYLISGSADGHVKFWKKKASGNGIEFAKDYKAHLGPVEGLVVSADGDLAASLSSADQTLKIFDVGMFDMIGMIRLGFTPTTVAWCFRPHGARGLIAVAQRGYVILVHTLMTSREGLDKR